VSCDLNKVRLHTCLSVQIDRLRRCKCWKRLSIALAGGKPLKRQLLVSIISAFVGGCVSAPGAPQQLEVIPSAKVQKPDERSTQPTDRVAAIEPRDAQAMLLDSEKSEKTARAKVDWWGFSDDGFPGFGEILVAPFLPLVLFTGDLIMLFVPDDNPRPDPLDDLKRDQLMARIEQGDASYEHRVELARLGVTHPLEELASSGDLQASVDLYQISGILRPLEQLAESGDPIAVGMLKNDPRGPARMVGGLSRREILEREEQGDPDPDAQLQVYYDPNEDTRHIWLCRAADNGNPEARYRLAVLYESGAEGLAENSLQAQVWYTLATYSGHRWGYTNARRLAGSAPSSESIQLQELLREWRPGQCENQLHSLPLDSAS